MTYFFVFLYCLVFTRAYARMYSDDPELKELWKVLDEGEKKFSVGGFDNVVLVVGNTGAGKSTLTQFLSGSAELRSVLSGFEYTIQESDAAEICSSTFTSCTQEPEVTVDEATRTAIWDNPGFSDTRGAANEIAATYFTLRLLSSVRGIKIVCVVPFDAVREGGSRDDFPNMVSNVAKMIPDIGKFAGSIAVVVTKVENLKLEGARVEDGAIVANVAKVMAAAKTALVGRQVSWPSKENEVKLIDLLLTRNGSFYPRIGLFRRPQKLGLLSTMEELQEEKAFLREMILTDGISYTPVSPQDFKYVVADKWKEQLRDLLEGSKKEIASDIEMIGEEVRTAFEKRIPFLRQRRDDLEEIKKYSRAVHDEFASLTASVGGKTFKEIMAKVRKICRRAKIEFEHEESNLLKFEKFVEFISPISGLPGLNRTQILRDSLAALVDYLKGARGWYSFLDVLHEALGSYSVQKNIKRYYGGTNQLLLLIKEGNVRATPFHTRLNEIVSSVTLDTQNPAVVESYQEVKNVELDEHKLEYLNYTLTVNLNYDILSSCGVDTLEVSGNFITANYVIAESRRCSRKFLEVFAANKLFIDKDIHATGTVLRQLSIIAPTWEVISHRSIVMDGLPGASFLPPREKAFGDAPGSKGRNGRAGRPGGSAGGVFGIGKKCIGCDRLVISVKGGRGGSGQDGGDGQNGEDGDKPPSPYDANFRTSEQICGASGNDVGGNAVKGAWAAGATGVAVAATGPIGLAVGAIIGALMPWSTHCFQDGRMGQRGGLGGRGGVGGKGGYGADAILIFSEAKYPTVHDLPGRSGNNGLDGMPGKDGSMGYRLTYRKESAATWGEIEGIDYVPLGLREPLGVPEGQREYDDPPAAPEPQFAFTGLPYVVERYVSFAKKNLPPTNVSVLNQFLRYVESDRQIAAIRKSVPSPRGKRSAVTPRVERNSRIPHSPWPRRRRSSHSTTLLPDDLSADSLIHSSPNPPQSLSEPAVNDQTNLMLSSIGRETTGRRVIKIKPLKKLKGILS